MLVREPIGMEGDSVGGSISLQEYVRVEVKRINGSYRLLYVFKRGLKLL